MLKASKVALLHLGLGCLLSIEPVRGGEDDSLFGKLSAEDDALFGDEFWSDALGAERVEDKEDVDEDEQFGDLSAESVRSGGDEEDDERNEKLGCVIDKNVDYHLYDIANGKKRTETQQECANFAYATKGAFFWKWHPNDKMCYLKNSNAKKGKKTRAGAVVGNINCACITFEDTDYNAHDLLKPGKRNVKTQEACADIAASTDGGLFWTWSKNTCYVKSSTQKQKKHTGAVSGNIKCSKN